MPLRRGVRFFRTSRKARWVATDHDPCLQFLLLIALLQVVPKLLGPPALELVPLDATLEQLARLGVAALFLFAGPEVDLADLA
jgi:hypothetical protein